MSAMMTAVNAVSDLLAKGARPRHALALVTVPRGTSAQNEEALFQVLAGVRAALDPLGVSLVGGETAEMPDTYLPGEHDLVGVITGVVEKDNIITGEKIQPGHTVLGLPSSGLHTNGYSFARKLFFEVGGYDVNDTIAELKKPVGLTLLEPHINYTNHIFAALNAGVDIKGISHITGGGLIENIPRILPDGCGVEIQKGSWPVLPVFDVMQSIGNVDQDEMSRAFNMGVGMVLIVDSNDVSTVKDVLKELTDVFEIGIISSNIKGVNFK